MPCCERDGWERLQGSLGDDGSLADLQQGSGPASLYYFCITVMKYQKQFLFWLLVSEVLGQLWWGKHSGVLAGGSMC